MIVKEKVDDFVFGVIGYNPAAFVVNTRRGTQLRSSDAGYDGTGASPKVLVGDLFIDNVGGGDATLNCDFNGAMALSMTVHAGTQMLLQNVVTDKIAAVPQLNVAFVGYEVKLAAV